MLRRLLSASRALKQKVKLNSLKAQWLTSLKILICLMAQDGNVKGFTLYTFLVNFSFKLQCHEFLGEKKSKLFAHEVFCLFICLFVVAEILLEVAILLGTFCSKQFLVAHLVDIYSWQLTKKTFGFWTS